MLSKYCMAAMIEVTFFKKIFGLWIGWVSLSYGLLSEEAGVQIFFWAE
jgi:hypothetical protein